MYLQSFNMWRDCFYERSTYSKNTDFWIRAQEGLKIPVWITVGFQQRDRQDSQKLNNDDFYRFPVTSTQYVFWTEKNLDSAILLNSDDDDSSQGYGQNIEAFRVLTKDDIFQPYIYLIVILYHLINVTILDILYTFSIYDIRKT